jgi:branched-chain amino acid transport system permease protein
MLGAFAALAAYGGLRALGVGLSSLELAVMVAVATAAMALVGMAIARYLVLPLRVAPALNTLLITLMAGTVLREGVRLFYPHGANPKPFPALLPKSAIDLGGFNLRLDNVIMLAVGALAIVGLQFLLNRTKLGLAIRAVAQDEETARTMGIDFTAIVLITFAIGSALAAFAGVIGGFLFAALQTAGAVLLPVASAYKDVFAFAVVIVIMAWRPTGLIQEKISERV